MRSQDRALHLSDNDRVQSCHMQSQRRDQQCRNKGDNRASTDLPLMIADRCHSLFGHVCRLSRDTSVSQALHVHLSIDAFTGTPAIDWKRPPGRPRRTWLQQVEEDIMGQAVSACQFATVDCLFWRSLYDPQPVKRSSE